MAIVAAALQKQARFSCVYDTRRKTHSFFEPFTPINLLLRNDYKNVFSVF